jgi:3-oxoadipate enol-lactonase
MSLYVIDSETTLNVVSTGTGTALIFLHYWGGSSRTFAPLISTLPSRFRSISIDFRGWGQSSGPQTPYGYSIKDLAIDVETLILKLDIVDFVLIGHSMGGKVAQLIGGRGAVKGLRGIVLIAPAPPSPLVLPAEMKEAQMTAYSTPDSADFAVRNVLSSSVLSDETAALLVEDIMKGSSFATLAWPTYSMLEDITVEVKEIKVPVLVIAGEFDKIEPSQRLQIEVVGKIDTAEMVVVQGSGHLLPIEAPEQVAKHIEEFLDKVIAF